MTNEFDEIIDELVSESLDHLKLIDQELGKLKATYQSADQYTQFFRSFHTICGSAGCVGFSKIASVAKEGERWIAELRDGKRNCDARAIEVIGSMSEVLKGMLAEVKITRKESDGEIEPIIASFISSSK